MKKTQLNTLKLLSALLPAGVLGMSAALASTPPADTPSPAASETGVPVASRLASIRDAVSTLATDEQAKGENVKTAWWVNWHGGGWRNGGWHNGGWGNGGWHNWANGWHNGGWHNWHNW